MKVFKFHLCAGRASGGRLVPALDIFEAKETLDKQLRESDDILDRTATITRWEECEYVDKKQFLSEAPIKLLSEEIQGRLRDKRSELSQSELTAFLKPLVVRDDDIFSEIIAEIQALESDRDSIALQALMNSDEALKAKSQLQDLKSRKLTLWERLTGRIQ